MRPPVLLKQKNLTVTALHVYIKKDEIRRERKASRARRCRRKN
jgi:hypothetical protein